MKGKCIYGRNIIYRLFFVAACFINNYSYAQQPLGEGIVKPPITAGATLYLYSGQLIDEQLNQAAIKDSLTMVQGQYNVEIGTAPPWFVPEFLKLDYDIFQLRAITISKNWIEVIVNRQTGKTAWVDRNAVTYLSWPEFFLEVFSVELISIINNPLRVKPLENASIVTNPGKNSLRPIAVKGEWMKVATMPDDPNAAPKLGWIRWRKGSQVLISWSLLS
jgi:hypothetical protein